MEEKPAMRLRKRAVLFVAPIVALAAAFCFVAGHAPRVIDRVQNGMPKAEVIEILGPPTTYDDESDSSFWKVRRGIVIVSWARGSWDCGKVVGRARFHESEPDNVLDRVLQWLGLWTSRPACDRMWHLDRAKV
jgi:hypothetical protein